TQAGSTTVTGQTIVTVFPGSATMFSITGFPSPTSAAIPGTFTVAATDMFGNLDPTYTGMVTFSSSDPQASLPDPFTFTSTDQGFHTFTATLNTVNNNATTTVTDQNQKTGTSAPIVVKPMTLAVLSFTPRAEGFTAHFDEALKTTVLNLYNSQLGGPGTA